MAAQLFSFRQICLRTSRAGVKHATLIWFGAPRNFPGRKEQLKGRQFCIPWAWVFFFEFFQTLPKCSKNRLSCVTFYLSFFHFTGTILFCYFLNSGLVLRIDTFEKWNSTCEESKNYLPRKPLLLSWEIMDKTNNDKVTHRSWIVPFLLEIISGFLEELFD